VTVQPVEVAGGDLVRRDRGELSGSFVVEHRIDSPSGIDQAGCGTLGRVCRGRPACAKRRNATIAVTTRRG
jgi:hypothetical protein